MCFGYKSCVGYVCILQIFNSDLSLVFSLFQQSLSAEKSSLLFFFFMDCAIGFISKKSLPCCTWLAQSEEHETLDLGAVSLSPT